MQFRCVLEQNWAQSAVVLAWFSMEEADAVMLSGHGAWDEGEELENLAGRTRSASAAG